MTYHFIVNPYSRTNQGCDIWRKIEMILKERKIAYDVVFTEHNNHAQSLAQEICSKDDTVKNIVVVGGDGTVNEVINGIPDYNKVILSYIPLGSGNDLARGLKLDKDPLKNLARILNPSAYRNIDHGVLRGESGESRTFAVSSSIGFDASVCYEVSHSKIKHLLNKIKLGRLSYFLIALKHILTNKMVDMDLSIDHAPPKHYRKVLLVAAMIQKYEGGGVKIAPSADPADGKLTLCIIHDINRFLTLILMPTTLLGKHTIFPMVDMVHCSHCEINAHTPCRVHTDGEDYGMQSHIIFSAKEQQIRMPS